MGETDSHYSLVQAFWKAVWFEETFIALYIREVELDTPASLGNVKEYEGAPRQLTARMGTNEEI